MTWFRRYRRDEQAARVEEARAQAEAARQDAELSRKRAESVRKHVNEPRRKAAARNQFAEMIEASLRHGWDAK